MEPNGVLKNLRSSFKQTQQQVADGCDMSISTYRKYERAERSMNLDVIYRFAAHFDVSYNIFIDFKYDSYWSDDKDSVVYHGVYFDRLRNELVTIIRNQANSKVNDAKKINDFNIVSQKRLKQLWRVKCKIQNEISDEYNKIKTILKEHK